MPSNSTVSSPCLVFFDIDGTLVDRESRIPQSALAAISELRRRGHLTFLNTGRSFSAIQADILQGPFDGVIAACGTHIEYHGQTLLNNLINPALMAEILPLMEASQIDLWLEGPEHIYIADLNPQGFLALVIQYFASMPGVMADWHREPVHAIRANKMSYHLRPESRMEDCLPLLEQYFTLISHRPEHGEIVPQGFTKATGIQFMLRHLDLPRHQTYAFGDSLNDVEMLDFVQYGIAMAGSRHHVLQVSNHVTGTPEEDGIANALRHYQLI